jgi:hypothetical protein
MIQFCIFGGQTSELGDRSKVYVTIFGVTEVRRLTLAKQLMQRQRAVLEQVARHYFVTLFGGAGLKLPTLAEEYLDLREALRSGALRIDEWDRGAADLTRDSRRWISSFTMFGAFDDAEAPSEEEELDRLALYGQMGSITPAVADLLSVAAGQANVSRSAMVRQALACETEALAPASL